MFNGNARPASCELGPRKPSELRGRFGGHGCIPGLLNAPEWTRTTTDHAVHKALNPFHTWNMGSRASRSSIWRGFLDALDASDDVDVATMLPRIEGPTGLRPSWLVPSSQLDEGDG
jgi:hypothetical protein